MDKRQWQALQRAAQEELDRLWRELPPAILDQVRRIPVVFQKTPGRDLVADGLDPDLLGLFVGDDYVREGADPLPPEILIFLVNIMDEAEGDWDRFRQEVRTTLLHEIGHYLGLDEEGLFERELE
jgi:predicted Zn-dependent protease with MMP-like domain